MTPDERIALRKGAEYNLRYGYDVEGIPLANAVLSLLDALEAAEAQRDAGGKQAADLIVESDKRRIRAEVAEVERDKALKNLDTMVKQFEKDRAEVSSLTAIRERAEAVMNVNAAGASPTRSTDAQIATARFILGAAPSPEPPPAYEHVGWLHPNLGDFWEAKEHENRAALESAGWVPVFVRDAAPAPKEETR